MRRPARGSHHQRGSALAIALLTLLLVSLAIVVITVPLGLEIRETRRLGRDVRLTALADAALAEALGELAEDASFPGYDPYEFKNAQLESTVTASGFEKVRVVVSARYLGATRRAEAQVQLGVGGPKVLSWRRVP
ncbi:MAG: hypothetical protein KDD11_16200 [Acidobacteria bacterium]|nr:hypothetical protein [Acidobacteriota bacterium]